MTKITTVSDKSELTFPVGKRRWGGNAVNMTIDLTELSNEARVDALFYGVMKRIADSFAASKGSPQADAEVALATWEKIKSGTVGRRSSRSQLETLCVNIGKGLVARKFPALKAKDIDACYKGRGAFEGFCHAWVLATDKPYDVIVKAMADPFIDHVEKPANAQLAAMNEADAFDEALSCLDLDEPTPAPKAKATRKPAAKEVQATKA